MATPRRGRGYSKPDRVTTVGDMHVGSTANCPAGWTVSSAGWKFYGGYGRINDRAAWYRSEVVDSSDTLATYTFTTGTIEELDNLWAREHVFDFRPQPLTDAFEIFQAEVEESKKARQAAKDLLYSVLDPMQIHSLEQTGFFVVFSQSGKPYQIQGGHVLNVAELDGQGRVVARLCALPEGVPDEDVMTAQVLMLRYAEEMFRGIANIRTEVQ